MEQMKMDTNVDIVLKYFKPIELPQDSLSVTSSQEYESNSEDNDKPDNELTSNTIEDNATQEIIDQTGIGIDSFIEHYGYEEATNIFNSITQYPPENMMTLLHSYEHELENTTRACHKRILENENAKLQKQIQSREEDHKKHLLSIILLSSSDNHMKVQKKYLLQYLSVNQLINIVLDMKGCFDIIEKLNELKSIEEHDDYEKDETFWCVCQKKAKEVKWACVEKILMNIKPVENECCICLTDPKEYTIVDCGHYCMCENCKEKIEGGDKPTCPICRTEITKIIKIYQ